MYKYLGYSPLIKSAEEGQYEVVQCLLSLGADIHQANDDGNHFNYYIFLLYFD